MAEATGRLIETERGTDLVLYRSLSIPIEEAWSFLTESELTERWFGPWEGDARPGSAVRIRLRFEAGEPAVRAQIERCERPSLLALHLTGEDSSRRLTLELEDDGADDSLLRFTHHLDADADVSEVGPGWEYYLDLLVAATEDAEEPVFDDYFPALREEYGAKRPE